MNAFLLYNGVMEKYILVFRQAIQDTVEYRFDFFMHTIKYALMVLVMALIWLTVEKEGHLAFSKQETVSYFAFSAALYSLSNFHTVYIEEDIQFGKLSKFLVKPLSPKLYYFSFAAAPAFVETLLKFIVIVPLLLLFGFSFSISIPNLLLFLLFLPVVFIFSFIFFSIISFSAFWITEAYAVRWSLNIFLRLSSGILVPISFFPHYYQKISFYLPFQHLAFTPIQIIQGTIPETQAIQALFILLFWSIVLLLVQKMVWKKGLLAYEGVGI